MVFGRDNVASSAPRRMARVGSDGGRRFGVSAAGRRDRRRPTATADRSDFAAVTAVTVFGRPRRDEIALSDTDRTDEPVQEPAKTQDRNKNTEPEWQKKDRFEE